MLELNFTEFPVLKTNRLLLRQINNNDVNDFFEIRSNKLAMQYIDRPIAVVPEDALKLIEVITDFYNKNEAITWAICLNENTTLIGTIGFWRMDKENYRTEIGYILHPKFHQQGLMQEAIEIVIDYGFNHLKFHSIMANINPKNYASQKLLEKNNFIKEAFFRENYFYNGKFLDSTIYSLINKN